MNTLDRDAKLALARKKLATFKRKKEVNSDTESVSDSRPSMSPTPVVERSESPKYQHDSTPAALNSITVMKPEAKQQTIEMLIEEKQELLEIQSKLTHHLQTFKSFLDDRDHEIAVLNQKISTLLAPPSRSVHELKLEEQVAKLKALNAELSEKCRHLSGLDLSDSIEKTVEAPATVTNGSHDSSEVKELKEIIARQADHLDSAYLANSEIKQNLVNVEKENVDLQSEIKQLENRLEVQSRASRAQADTALQISELSKALEEKQQELESLAAANRTLEQEFEKTNKELSTLQAKAKQNEQLRATWLQEIDEKRKISDMLSSTSERLALLTSENTQMLAALEEMRERFVAVSNDKMNLAQQVDTLNARLEKIAPLNDSPKDENADQDKKLAEARRESQVLINKWASSEDARREIEEKCLLLQNQLDQLALERDELLKADAEAREIRNRVEMLESETVHTREEYARVTQQFEIAKKETELIKAIWKHEKDGWDLERKRLVEGVTAEEHSSPRKSTSKRPSAIDTPADEPASPIVDSVILGQIKEFKDKITSLDQVILELQNENTRIVGLLEKERKLNTLLTAEVDALPDYIFLYHQERKALMKQMQRMVQKIRKEALSGAPLESSLIWDSREFRDDGGDEKTLKKQIESTLSRGGSISGMVLSGQVFEVGKCRRCYGEEIEI